MNSPLHKVLDGASEGWWMFFDTFWALVFGFALSGFVQASVSRSRMRNLLGDHGGKSVARASFFGMVSSSCSYAASALAHSIFKKGADFTSSMIFMFASTNLVIELGIVLWLLIGWQFAVAEFAGGAFMILLLAITIPKILPEKIVRGTALALKSGLLRKNLLLGEEQGIDIEEFEAGSSEKSLRQKLGYSAGYTVGDFIMLRWELFIGFLVAGLAMAVVPFSFWKALFLSGHGFWSALENALVGPFLAIISFVCSVGNVPLAGALWHSGISFGGVIAFVFADLISLPLIFIYRKYYGNKIALRMTLLFWAVMSVSGLVTEGAFAILKKIPNRGQVQMGNHHFGLNATTILNAISLLISFVIFYLYKNPPKNIESDFAQDPICGMQVRKSDAPASFYHDGLTYYFCMEGCRDKFVSGLGK